jgi:hypothetical protein
MDFSEYTLVSFGDSFTFGEDTIPKPEFLLREPVDTELEQEYITGCNSNSYTQFLTESLGFKDSINFGFLGASNDRSMMSLESFLRSNPKKKVFILFNFTSSSRYVQFFKIDDKNEYEVVGMNPSMISSDGKVTYPWKTNYTGVNPKTLAQNWGIFRNSMQDVFNHIKQRRALYYLLSSYDVPYLTFDGINDLDYRMVRDNPFRYVSKKAVDGTYSSFLYNDDDRYVWKEMDFFNSYHKELVDGNPLLNHLTISDLNENRNLQSYLSNLGNSHNGDVDHYISDYGIHWNIDGHMEVAILLYKFINERYN